MKNLNLLFNKIYYEKLGTPDFAGSLDLKNTEIFNTVFDHSRDYSKSLTANQTFLLKTVYPGLLIGTGYAHGSHQQGVDSDINCGFSFDYVTGQPYIPGSSVKGVLRSHFDNYPEVITEITGITDVKSLTAEIFDGNDVFLDAVVYDGDKNARLIGSDYITPHDSPTKNPIPILIIKILPDVRFEFRFKLNEGKLISAYDKENLFKTLLMLFGVGAKTNVGYGILEECTDEILQKINIQTPAPQRREDNNNNRNNNTGRVNTSLGPTKKKCPQCGVMNYKFKKDSTEITWNWKDNICYKCGKDLE